MAPTQQSGISQRDENTAKRSNKTPEIETNAEAYQVPDEIQQLIVGEFRVVQSSRRLARKYGLSVNAVQDMAIRAALLAVPKPPQSERGTLATAATRRIG